MLRFFDEFLKLRVAAQWIPKRHQFQLAIAEVARATQGNSKLFASEIFVTEPRSDHRQILDHHVATDLIFFYWKKLDRAPAFAQCFLFPTKTGVDQTKHAQRRPVIWLNLDDFLLLRAGSDKSGPRSTLIFRHSSDNGFYKQTIKRTFSAEPKVIGFPPNAVKAFLAAAPSRSARAQTIQLSAILGIAAGFVARIDSII